jgi:hypothetical protein
MLETSTNLPATEANDVAEVIAALETARELWTKGQALESVRWIQRAAENAEEAGNDLRAVSLARAAADLRAEVSVASETPAPVTQSAGLAPYDEFTESTIVDSPASSLARVAIHNNVQIAELQPASSPPATPASVPAPAVAAPPPPPPPLLATPASVPAPLVAAPPPPPPPPPLAPPPAIVPAAMVTPATPAAPIVRPLSAAQHQALRVCVIGAGSGARELSVRILNEGEVVPAGATEALLVSLDSKASLL